jgi:hypothetical protein
MTGLSGATVAPDNVGFRTSSIAFACYDAFQCRFHDRIFQTAKRAFEDVVVERLLTKHLLELHLAPTDRAGWFLYLRHDSSLSANADCSGFRLRLGWLVNAPAENGCRGGWNFIFPQ